MWPDENRISQSGATYPCEWLARNSKLTSLRNASLLQIGATK
jgi:hypothetical protein